VLAELLGDHGGFLSAIDAETDGHEGAYYTWTRDELQQILGRESFGLLAPVFGCDAGPNFEHDRYVLHLPQSLADRAREAGLDVAALLARLEPGRKALLEARWKRKRPLVDDKVLTDWNGLMIAALARGGSVLHEPRYVDAAGRAARFVLETLRDPSSGTLLHTYRGGVAKIPALLDDYAFLTEALLALHAATNDPGWLAGARQLADEQERRLGDRAAGGYFSAGEDPRLLLRPKAAYDGAVASGAGVAALNLTTLAERTGDTAYRETSLALVRAHGGGIRDYPLAHVTLVRALARLDVAGAPAGPRSGGLLAEEAEAVVEASGTVAESSGPWKRFSVDLMIRDGWHVNANAPRDPSLVPTRVEAVHGTLRALCYPETEDAVYTGRVRIEGEVESGVDAVRLTYQACDDSRCLPPVTREVLLR
jgi:uncharacterized protein YyaL (SSP411 family)